MCYKNKEMCYKNNDNHVSGTSKLSQITATYRFKVQIKLSLLMINGDKVNIGSPNKKNNYRCTKFLSDNQNRRFLLQ